MTKPLGGRGQKAPYETVQVRCPVPIKSEVDALISAFRESVLSGESKPNQRDSDVIYQDCLKLVFKFMDENDLTEQLGDKKISRMYRLNQFVQWLEWHGNQI